MKPRILAAKSPTVIEFVLIEEGPWHESKRGQHGKQLYSTKEMLRAAVEKFNGLPVQVITRNVQAGGRTVTIADHIPSDEKIALGKSGNSFYLKDIAGFIRSPRLEEIEGKLSIIGPVHFHDERVAQTLRAAIEAGDLDMIGGSIDGVPARFDLLTIDGNEYEVPWIESLDTWDLVTLPAAGGRMLRLAASRSINEEKESNMTAKQKAVFSRLLHAAGVTSETLEKVFADNADFGTEALAALRAVWADKPELLKELGEISVRLGKSETAEQAIADLGKMEEKLIVKPEPVKVEQVKPEPVKVDPKIEADPAVVEAKKILEEAKAANEGVKTQLGEMEIERQVTNTKLPDAVQDNIRASLRASREYDPKKISAAIDAHRKYLSDIGAANIPGIRITASIGGGLNEVDHLMDRMETMFTKQPVLNAKKELVKPIRSFRELWRIVSSQDEIEKGYDAERFFRKIGAGMTRGYGSDGEAFCASDFMDLETGRLTASLTTSDWASIMASTMHRRMATDYKVDAYQDWRKIVEIVSIEDLRTHYFARMGGYPTAPVVAEGGTYQEVTSSPGDEASSLVLYKYGHIETITEEMVINDDMRSLATLTQRLARGMAIDIHLMVFDPITNNDAVAYGTDTDTLIHASSHSNGAAASGSALTDDTYKTGYDAMAAQSAYGDTRAYLENEPKYLIVGYKQKRMAQWIVNQNNHVQEASTGVYTAASGLGNPYAEALTGVISLKHITSTTNWWMVSDPLTCPHAIVGFHNGKDTPELVTEAAGTGAHFTADSIRIKPKLRRGHVLHDHRGIYGQLA
jgi:hypothetical protein